MNDARARPCRPWFHPHRDANVFAVRHATFETAGAIGRTDDARYRPRWLAGGGQNLVVDLRAGQVSDGRTESDAHGLDGLNGHQRLRELAVQLAIPLDVAAEAGWHAMGDDLEGATDGIAGFLRLIDDLSHLGSNRPLHTPHVVIHRQADDLIEGDCGW